MNINIEELQTIIAESYQVGYMEAVRCYEPAQDFIKTKDLKKWLSSMHMDWNKFLLFIDKGFVTPIRKGTCVNSPLLYSKKEIKKAFSMAKLSGIISKDEVIISFKQ